MFPHWEGRQYIVKIMQYLVLSIFAINTFYRIVSIRMNVLILGYGYCGYHLAKKLVENNVRVTTLSRSLSKSDQLTSVIHRKGDLTTPLNILENFDCIYYLAPPLKDGKKDNQLAQCLANNQFDTKRLMYFGSSAVYGDHQGEWVDESSDCHISFDSQKRRLDAEKQFSAYANRFNIPLTLLRIAGIYGPGRLPLRDLVSLKPMIDPMDAPWSNLIFIGDLVNVVHHLTGEIHRCERVNIADGHPRKMGALKQVLGQTLDLPMPTLVSRKELLSSCSSMMKMFLSSNKRVSIKKINAYLPNYTFSSIEDGVLSALQTPGMGS